jgi:hypothetical protein
MQSRREDEDGMDRMILKKGFAGEKGGVSRTPLERPCCFPPCRIPNFVSPALARACDDTSKGPRGLDAPSF